MQNYHNNVKLLQYQRLAIQQVVNPNFTKLATEYEVSRQTIAKWHRRNFICDKSSKPNNPRYALTFEQKIFIKDIHLKSNYTVEQPHELTSKMGINASKSSIYRCVKQNI